MLSSWKKMTFGKGYKYFNALFNWIDSADYAIKYRRKYNYKRFFLIKFEDIHSNPKKISKKLCNFFGVKFDRNMLDQNKWKRLLNIDFSSTNVTAYKKKRVYGFSKKRSENWKEKLNDWEVALIEYLCKSRMKKLGYKPFYKKNALYKKGIKIIKSDKILKKRLKNLIQFNRGTDKKLNDAKNPKNWAVLDKNSVKKFKDTHAYKYYLKEIKFINQESKKYQ